MLQQPRCYSSAVDWSCLCPLILLYMTIYCTRINRYSGSNKPLHYCSAPNRTVLNPKEACNKYEAMNRKRKGNKVQQIDFDNAYIVILDVCSCTLRMNKKLIITVAGYVNGSGVSVSWCAHHNNSYFNTVCSSTLIPYDWIPYIPRVLNQATPFIWNRSANKLTDTTHFISNFSNFIYNSHSFFNI